MEMMGGGAMEVREVSSSWCQWIIVQYPGSDSLMARHLSPFIWSTVPLHVSIHPTELINKKGEALQNTLCAWKCICWWDWRDVETKKNWTLDVAIRNLEGHNGPAIHVIKTSNQIWGLDLLSGKCLKVRVVLKGSCFGNCSYLQG